MNLKIKDQIHNLLQKIKRKNNQSIKIALFNI